MSNLEAKKQAVQEIQSRLQEANLVVFTDYRGLNVGEMNELRGKLKAAGAEYKVVKNTLTRFALQNIGLEEMVPYTEGPNAVLFSTNEPVEPAKILFDFARTHKNLEVKVGILEGNVIGVDQIKGLSTLPSREVLIAQVLGGLQAPLYGFAYVLKANLSGLVRALDAIREQKEAS
ncbi:MAG: 50S ribosomal protein L10 [Syntrophomonadales bacterium]